MKPLGCSPQWASYIILTQAVSAYEKYITFAFIEFKTATLCFVKSPMVNDSVRMHTSSLPGYQGAVLFKYVKRISEILVFLKRFFFSPCAQFCAFGGGEEGRCQTQSGMGVCGGVLGKDKWE